MVPYIIYNCVVRNVLMKQCCHPNERNGDNNKLTKKSFRNWWKIDISLFPIYFYRMSGWFFYCSIKYQVFKYNVGARKKKYILSKHESLIRMILKEKLNLVVTKKFLKFFFFINVQVFNEHHGKIFTKYVLYLFVSEYSIYFLLFL